MAVLKYLLPIATLLVGQAVALPTNFTTTALSGQYVNDIRQCPPLPKRTVPSSVKDLRPDDFKAIMALGDSITAGFAAEGLQLNPIENLFENRGLSFSMGGDRGAISLANMFKTYSSGLRGASTGDRIVSYCGGSFCPPGQYRDDDYFNAAQSGAKVQNLDYEANWLIGRVKADRNINIQNDWKFLQILIGANDMCGVCKDGKLTGDVYERQLRAVLEKIRTNLPRTVVNVMSIFKVSQVWDLTKNEFDCKVKRAIGLKYLCECAFPDGDTASGVAKRKVMDDYANEWNARLFKLVDEYRGKYDDFAVVADPAGANTPLTQYKEDFVSNLDCFHPATSAHQFMAKNLWNNLFLSSANKQQKWGTNMKPQIYCPTEADRIQVL
ncbi:hypothetical protein HDU85_002136 [Gaertneriomyces sp. JEL0708]|nr:hypothetical protein HDU85_002136 [Gaertneriomyces sp. JEL0708]